MSQKNEEEFISPHWHVPIVKESLAELASGKAEVTDWSEAKERLNNHRLEAGGLKYAD